MPTVDSIKATFVGCQNIKNQFIHSHGIMLISVGQVQHESANLESMVSLINKSFRCCTIAVCDSLQRHNIDINNSYANNKYHGLANSKGDDWISRNQHRINLFNIPVMIKRWDDWLTNETFHEQLKIVMNLYKNNNIFYTAIHETINQFTNRFIKNNKIINPNYEIIFTNCLNYLIEEIAIMMLIMPNEGYQFVLYPNKFISAFTVAHDIFLKSNGINLMNWVHVQLKRKSSTLYY